MKKMPVFLLALVAGLVGCQGLDSGMFSSHHNLIAPLDSSEKSMETTSSQSQGDKFSVKSTALGSPLTKILPTSTDKYNRQLAVDFATQYDNSLLEEQKKLSAELPYRWIFTHTGSQPSYLLLGHKHLFSLVDSVKKMDIHVPSFDNDDASLSNKVDTYINHMGIYTGRVCLYAKYSANLSYKYYGEIDSALLCLNKDGITTVKVSWDKDTHIGEEENFYFNPLVKEKDNKLYLRNAYAGKVSNYVIKDAGSTVKVFEVK